MTVHTYSRILCSGELIRIRNQNTISRIRKGNNYKRINPKAVLSNSDNNIININIYAKYENMKYEKIIY